MTKVPPEVSIVYTTLSLLKSIGDTVWIGSENQIVIGAESCSGFNRLYHQIGSRQGQGEGALNNRGGKSTCLPKCGEHSSCSSLSSFS